MSDTLLFLIMVGILGTCLLLANYGKRYRIRRTGRRILARVVQVNYYQATKQVQDIPLYNVPAAVGRWRYEVIAEWSDQASGNVLRISSGLKNGLPRCQRGDYLCAYISPQGSYLESA